MTKGVSFVDENNNSSIAQKWDFGDRKREIIYPVYPDYILIGRKIVVDKFLWMG